MSNMSLVSSVVISPIQDLILVLVAFSLIFSVQRSFAQYEPYYYSNYYDTYLDDDVSGRLTWVFDYCAGYGCYKGYCWARCRGFMYTFAFPLMGFKDQEWCYTTKGYSQDFQYVSCKEDSECGCTWKCAGSCTL